MELRKFTDKGLEQFRGYLHELSDGSAATPPLHLLTDPEFSKPMRGSVQLEYAQFASRLDLARNLDQTFEGLPERPDKLMNDIHPRYQLRATFIMKSPHDKALLQIEESWRRCTSSTITI